MGARTFLEMVPMVVARASELALKLKLIDYTKAAAVPLAGLTAWLCRIAAKCMRCGYASFSISDSHQRLNIPWKCNY